MSGLARVVLILGVLGVRSALALDPARHITELAHRSWGSKDGAPSYMVALAQTGDGYLWIASYSGLYRFDGTQFQPFRPLSGPKLLSREIDRVFASRDNTLWIGYRNGGGVSALRAGRLINYNSTDGIPIGRVNGFAQDRAGRIWAAFADGLARFDGGQWRTVGKESNFPGVGAQAVLVDHLGVLWVAGDHRIAVLPPGSSEFELTDEPYNGRVRQLAESPDGTVWMAETTRAVRPLTRPGEANALPGLSRADCQNRFPDTWQTEPGCQRADDLEVRVGSQALLFDSNGSLWITTLGDGLRRAAYPSRLRKQPIGEFSGVLEQFTTKDGLSADYVTYILEDREGNVWVTTDNGIDQFRASALAPVELGPNDAGFSMQPDSDGYVFLEGAGRIFRLHDSHAKPVVVDSDAGTSSLSRDSFGAVWSAGTRGACQLVDHRCIDNVQLPADKPVPWPGKWRFAVDAKRRGWAYLESDGLFVRENGRWSAVTGAPTGVVPFTQFSDASGQIWFGLSNGLLVSVKDGRIRTYSSDEGLNVGVIKAIDSLGAHVWVGGQGGVALLRGSRFTPVLPSDAAAFDDVSGVVEADDGSLWLVEYRGVIRIPPEEVGRIVHSAAYRPHYEVLNYLDGLPGDTERVRYLPAAIRGTDGRLWFAAAHGIAWVNPRQLHRNRLPPLVSIQMVVADGQLHAPSAKVELRGTTANLQIAYSGLSLSVPERVHFRYRLRGFDHEWQNVGTRRTAYYTRLPPGSYDFQVVASNDSGIWNDVGAELPIRIIPAWYQTRWFYTLAALLVVAALTGLYRLRVAQVRADTRRLLEARLSERERIARDLHDTLLQGFQGLMFRLQAVRQLLPERPGDAEKFLDSAMEAGDQAIGEARDAVESLRTSSADDRDLATSLGTLGSELGVGIPSQSMPQYRVVVEGRPRELAGDIRDDTYRIVREAVRNAYQHAKARHIETELNFGDSDLCIRVRDDGIGVDPQILAQGQRPGHWGLPGMRERSESCGGRLHVWSERNAGTEVELRIPARIAYVRRGAN